jgi:hypothetical protein
MARSPTRIISPHKRLGLFSLTREAVVDRWGPILILIDSCLVVRGMVVGKWRRNRWLCRDSTFHSSDDTHIANDGQVVELGGICTKEWSTMRLIIIELCTPGKNIGVSFDQDQTQGSTIEMRIEYTEKGSFKNQSVKTRVNRARRENNARSKFPSGSELVYRILQASSKIYQCELYNTAWVRLPYSRSQSGESISAKY